MRPVRNAESPTKDVEIGSSTALKFAVWESLCVKGAALSSSGPGLSVRSNAIAPRRAGIPREQGPYRRVTANVVNRLLADTSSVPKNVDQRRKVVRDTQPFVNSVVSRSLAGKASAENTALVVVPLRGTLSRAFTRSQREPSDRMARATSTSKPQTAGNWNIVTSWNRSWAVSWSPTNGFTTRTVCGTTTVPRTWNCGKSRLKTPQASGHRTTTVQVAAARSDA